YAREQSSQETPNYQTSFFEYADGAVIEFGTRGGFTNDEGSVKIANLFYGSKGWLWIEEKGKTWQSYFGPTNEKGPGAEMPTGESTEATGLTTTESPHHQNFLGAIRAADPKVLTCDVLEGHMSSTLPHLANISYRVGRSLTFDGKAERFVDDKQADHLLTREYRKGFEIPSSFSTSSQEQGRRERRG